MSKKKPQAHRSESARKAAEMVKAQQAKDRRRTVLIHSGVPAAAAVEAAS